MKSGNYYWKSFQPLIIFFFFLAYLVNHSSGQGGIFDEPLSTRAPVFRNVPSPWPPSSQRFGNLQKPYPTNSFWTNLVLKDGTTRISVSPYQVRTVGSGVLVSLPSLTVSNKYILAGFLASMSMETSETLSERKIKSYDLVSVTVDWNGLSIPLVQGSPYITGIFDKKTPVFKTIHAITSLNGKSDKTATGKRFEVALNNKQTWIIYTQSDITLTWSGNQLKASSPFSGVIRLACSTGSAMTNLLNQGASVYPTGAQVTYTKPSANEATISFTWTTQGGSADQLLMSAMPHHLDTFVDTNVVMNKAYTSLRGDLALVRGRVWKMKEALPTIEWDASNPIDSSKVADIVAALERDKNLGYSASDPYFFGKQIARNGRLALIADQLNKTDIATSIRNGMKAALNPWLTGANANPLQYDTSWGGICSKRGFEDSGADFGNGVYNDHHFHYGYHIYAAAAIAKKDPGWLQTYSEQVTNLVREYANPSLRDSYFPVTRHKDWYSGHSWASGITVFGDSKNQESTSESINGYYAVYLWGLVSGNQQLKDLGRVMLATEIRTTMKYWQMTKDSSVYPEPFASNKVVGILWSTKVDYATWFGSNVEFIHCIQMLPFTPISELHLPKTWIKEQSSLLSAAFSRNTPKLSEGWKGYIYMAHAIDNPSTGWNNVKTLTSFDGGNTKTNTLYWVATRR